MATSKEQSAPVEGKVEQVPLAPACLVVLIFLGVILSVLCAFGSWWVNQNQPEMAQRALKEQLIPWVEQSPMEPTDKQAIVDELNSLVRQIQGRQLDEPQLRRLKFCLQDNPVLMWGFVQGAIAEIDRSEMPDLEKEQAKRSADRLLRLANEYRLSKTELEMILQTVTRIRANPNTSPTSEPIIEVRTDASLEELRKFVERMNNAVNGKKVPNEAFDKSPSQVFAKMIDEALEGKLQEVPNPEPPTLPEPAKP